jgi:xanthine dehydrogenase small subunit
LKVIYKKAILIKFILNNAEISSNMPPGMLLLDFIRYHQNLKGTKIGCREGDCGACTVLIGELKNGELNYSSATSCLTALGNIHHKHVVTIEGVNMDELNPIQQAMCDEAGTQCGFCTPGFIVSMAGFCLSSKQPSYKNALASVDGNICRCTGYKSIERALSHVSNLMLERKEEEPIEFVTSKAILPSYFNGIKERLKLLALQPNGQVDTQSENPRFLGGGTDLYVQQHAAMVHAEINFLSGKPELKTITRQGDKCIVGGGVTVSDLINSPVICEHFPKIQDFAKLVSSTPIRNIATLAGNFVNGSPIGDFSIFFLALNATIVLNNGGKTREVVLDQFYKGYKQLDKQAGEYISAFWFKLPDKKALFNFEKVSKRTHLDIASVNTAIRLVMDDSVILDARLTAGGVAPFPLLLAKTSAFLIGKELNEELIAEAIRVVQTEVAPISDARGTTEYKRLLLSQLIKAHFIKLFPLLEVDKLLA